jgi:NADPH:quinone reductase-like Zn-dependent oxidoreductase
VSTESPYTRNPPKEPQYDLPHPPFVHIMPPTMKAWQYSSTKGGLEKNLRLNTSAPKPTPKPDQHLVQVLKTALNPIDYKPAEFQLLSRFAIPKPATPGLDFVGYLVTPAAGSSLKPGQLVYGVVGTTPLAGGGLAEYALSKGDQVIALPQGVDPTHAATLGVASLTGYQTIVPYVKAGDKIFINGGSGGTGVFGIQIAKAVGCYVATSCSTANVDLCKSLGADMVIDYKQHNVLQALKASGHSFDHVVDNVGTDFSLYWKCHEYTKPGAIFMNVAGHITLHYFWDSFLRKVWPGFLGGGKRKSQGFFTQAIPSQLEQVATWMKEGKLRALIDEEFPFERAPEAVAKLKTGRAKGKILVKISSMDFKP